VNSSDQTKRGVDRMSADGIDDDLLELDNFRGKGLVGGFILAWGQHIKVLRNFRDSWKGENEKS